MQTLCSYSNVYKSILNLLLAEYSLQQILFYPRFFKSSLIDNKAPFDLAISTNIFIFILENIAIVWTYYENILDDETRKLFASRRWAKH